jgi:hypothetical protein
VDAPGICLASHSQVLISTQSSSFLDNFESEDLIVVDRDNKESIFKRPNPMRWKHGWMSTVPLSRQRPFPSMLTLAPADSNRPVNDAEVNCTPWSVLNTFGQPRRNASSNASRQNAASSVFDSRYDNTQRLCQSIPAVR